jgi:hypothetical protein
MRAVLVRYAAVIGIGLAVLVGMLYYASNVDGRAPLVQAIRLTLHISDDERLALTTSGIEVEFSEPVRPETAEAAFRIEPEVSGAFSWSGSVLRFTPDARLPLETDYALHLEAGVVDEAGNRMPEPSAPFEFRTVGPPGVAATEPADGAVNVPLDAPITIRFNTFMDTASVEDALSISPYVAFESSWSAERLTITPSRQLREGTRYEVRIGTDALDSAGIPVEDEFAFGFETASAPIEATGLVPTDDSEGISQRGPIAVFFDRELAAGQDLDAVFTIEPDVAGTLETVAPPGAAGLADPDASVLRFEPSGPLAPSTTYRVTLQAGIAAADGSQLADALEWSFTTGTPFDTLGNQLVFLSDRGGVTNLWAMNPDGSGQRQVSAELSPVIDYAVSPDGRRVVLGDGAVLVLQTADGADRTVLTAIGALEFDAAWAPDGSRFAFGRADLVSGAGEGLWTRAADGGDERRLELPVDGQPSPIASPPPLATPSEEAASAPLLRAPRYAPDGTAIAFVDASGEVGILNLLDGDEALHMADALAVAAPVWLLDSSGVLVTSLPGGQPLAAEPGVPLPPLVAEPPLLRADEIARLEVLRMDRRASRMVSLDLPPGAHGLATSATGLLYLKDGRAFLADDPRSPDDGRQLLRDDPTEIGWAGFGVEDRRLVLALREGGIWLLDAFTGRIEELSPDGYQARWLP